MDSSESAYLHETVAHRAVYVFLFAEKLHCSGVVYRRFGTDRLFRRFACAKTESGDLAWKNTRPDCRQAYAVHGRAVYDNLLSGNTSAFGSVDVQGNHNAVLRTDFDHKTNNSAGSALVRKGRYRSFLFLGSYNNIFESGVLLRKSYAGHGALYSDRACNAFRDAELFENVPAADKRAEIAKKIVMLA